MSLRIVFIGAGNLATHLSIELKRNGFNVVQVYSRTSTSAYQLAQKLEADYTTRIDDLVTDADIYFIALKDSVVDEVLYQTHFRSGLVVHCSGSLPLDVLLPYSNNIGVLYPLQTFSKSREVDFQNIPVFIEGNTPDSEELLLYIANKLSVRVAVLNSEKRLYLHIAAVFSCNFVNHFYTIASEVLQSQDIPFDVVHPLIAETASKALSIEPRSAQTGPAIRYDRNVIDKHLNALTSFPEFRKLYKEVSLSIHNLHQNIS